MRRMPVVARRWGIALLLLLLLFALSHNTLSVHWQIAAYCISALAGGAMFYLWRSMEQDNRKRIWWLYVLLFPQRIVVTCLPDTDGSAR